MAQFTRKQIQMRSKIRRLFPKKRISISMFESPRNFAVVHLLGVVGREQGQRILRDSGLFITDGVRYQRMLDNFQVMWK